MDLKAKLSDRQARIETLRAQRQGSKASKSTDSSRESANVKTSLYDDSHLQHSQSNTITADKVTIDSDPTSTYKPDSQSYEDSHPSELPSKGVEAMTERPEVADVADVQSPSMDEGSVQNQYVSDNTIALTSSAVKKDVCGDLKSDIHHYLVKADAKTNNALAKILQSKYSGDYSN